MFTLYTRVWLYSPPPSLTPSPPSLFLSSYYSPVAPVQPLYDHETTGGDGQFRNRLSSYFSNSKKQTIDHVNKLLRSRCDTTSSLIGHEDTATRSQGGSPIHESRGKIGSYYAHSFHGQDKVNDLLTTGPQPEFYSKESERKQLLKEKLARRTEESKAEHRQMQLEEEEYIQKNPHSKTYCSHMVGASGAVADGAGHHSNISHIHLATTPTLASALQSYNAGVGLTLQEWQLLQEKKSEEQIKSEETARHDHLKGASAVMESSVTFQVSTAVTDERTKDNKRTERMILARIAGSGSVPALKQALRAADGSNSGVLNEEEFKRAMVR